MSIFFEGQRRLLKTFEKLADEIDSDQVEADLLHTGERVATGISAMAPEGPTGNLKKSPKAARFKRKVPGNPAVFVAIDRKIAPHAHLVEYGTVKMAAQPFFRPVIDSSHGWVRGEQEKAVKASIKRVT